MPNSVLATAFCALLLISTPALAFGLTEPDYDYLATQHFAKDSSILQGLSPKEQARLHAIITDATTSRDPAMQAKNVGDAMATFQEHQNWELAHPGLLWDDSPKR
ncbi:MAG: hypothetical protein WAL80_14005 [Xanthobacteraceae bacterium]|jgi:hypothetical protein